MAKRKRGEKKRGRGKGKGQFGRPADLWSRIQRELGSRVIDGATLPGRRKMSEVLLEFAEPYLDYDGGLESFRGGVGAAATAWNLSLLAREERGKFLDDMFRGRFPDIGADAREAMIVFIRELVLRKEMYYPDDTRFIVGYEAIETEDGFHLNVASLFDPSTLPAD